MFKIILRRGERIPAFLFSAGILIFVISSKRFAFLGKVMGVGVGVISVFSMGDDEVSKVKGAIAAVACCVRCTHFDKIFDWLGLSLNFVSDVESFRQNVDRLPMR